MHVENKIIFFQLKKKNLIQQFQPWCEGGGTKCEIISNLGVLNPVISGCWMYSNTLGSNPISCFLIKQPCIFLLLADTHDSLTWRRVIFQFGGTKRID